MYLQCLQCSLDLGIILGGYISCVDLPVQFFLHRHFHIRSDAHPIQIHTLGGAVPAYRQHRSGAIGQPEGILIVTLAGGVLTGMAGLTAAMVLTPILCSVCGWSGYDAVTLSLIANVPSAMVTCWTFYKNGNIQMKKGMPMAVVAFAGAVVGSYLGYLFITGGCLLYLSTENQTMFLFKIPIRENLSELIQ